jgi:hypothetical protein
MVRGKSSWIAGTAVAQRRSTNKAAGTRLPGKLSLKILPFFSQIAPDIPKPRARRLSAQSGSERYTARRPDFPLLEKF